MCEWAEGKPENISNIHNIFLNLSPPLTHRIWLLFSHQRMIYTEASMTGPSQPAEYSPVCSCKQSPTQQESGVVMISISWHKEQRNKQF